MIQSYALFTILFSLPVNGDEISDLVRKTKALELYIQDEQDHDKYCSHLPWEQPEIQVYREKLESQLTEQCQKRVMKGKAQEE
jgi:FPC/CPF motif-containing protein YcgG